MNTKLTLISAILAALLCSGCAGMGVIGGIGSGISLIAQQRAKAKVKRDAADCEYEAVKATPIEGARRDEIYDACVLARAKQ